jgi:predicted dehydrogenase
MLNVGIIGNGYWGSKVYSRIKSLDNDFKINFVCDTDNSKFKTINKNVSKINDYKKALNFKNLDAIFICSNPISHFKIASFFLKNKINVFVEKPICKNFKEFSILKKISKQKNVVLYEDLIFLHDDKIKALKKIICKKSFGKPLVFNSSRSNLGGFQYNTDVVDDLLTHDLSILFYFFNNKLIRSNCVLHKTIKKLPPSIAFLTMKFSNNLLVNLTLSWHSPFKVREINIVGQNHMLAYDGIKNDDSIRLLKKSFNYNKNSKFDYRIGSSIFPNINNKNEALLVSINKFKHLIIKKDINNEYIKISEKIIKAKDLIKKKFLYF